MSALEKAVADFEGRPATRGGEEPPGQDRADHCVGDALGRSGQRGDRVVDGSQAELARSTLAAHHRLVRASLLLPKDGIDDELTDTPNYLDLSRTSVPQARPTMAYRHATQTAAKILLATLLAGGVGVALDLDRPDWAIVSALLILQWGPERVPDTIRGLHRLVGSLVGIGLFAGFHILEIEGLSLLLALAVCQFFAEFFVVRNYALTVIFTTPLALLMGDAMADPLGEVVVSRTAEIVLSIIFGIGVLWVWSRNSVPRHHARLVRHCFDAMGSLLGALMTARPEEALSQRRDLQFELLSERRAAQTLANDHPDVARERWELRLAVQMAGYRLLDSASLHPELRDPRTSWSPSPGESGPPRNSSPPRNRGSDGDRASARSPG